LSEEFFTWRNWVKFPNKGDWICDLLTLFLSSPFPFSIRTSVIRIYHFSFAFEHHMLFSLSFALINPGYSLSIYFFHPISLGEEIWVEKKTSSREIN